MLNAWHSVRQVLRTYFVRKSIKWIMCSLNYVHTYDNLGVKYFLTIVQTQLFNHETNHEIVTWKCCQRMLHFENFLPMLNYHLNSLLSFLFIKTRHSCWTKWRWKLLFASHLTEYFYFAESVWKLGTEPIVVSSSCKKCLVEFQEWTRTYRSSTRSRWEQSRTDRHLVHS